MVIWYGKNHVGIWKTALTSKIETDSREHADSSGENGMGEWRDGAKKKKKKELMDIDNSMVIVGWWGEMGADGGGRGYRKNNGMEKIP